MDDHPLVKIANVEFSSLLKRARRDRATLGLALGLGVSEIEYRRLELYPVTVPAQLLYKAVGQLGVHKEAAKLWHRIQREALPAHFAKISKSSALAP